MKPLGSLFEREGLPSCGLPAALAAAYGGDFGLARPEFYANFVASVDGVVALPGGCDSGQRVSGGDEPDRFIMGLLRASADAVMIGVGTFRLAAGDLWHPETAYPPATESFAELRRMLGLRPHPVLVVVTGSGHLDTSQQALRDCLILTTPQGEYRLRGTLPEGARVAVVGAEPFTGRSLLDYLHTQGLQTILVEGGPTLVGPLLAEGLIDELFLTTSPLLFGRYPGDGRKSLVEGLDLGGRPMELASLRRHESHLYLRYTF
ncbi:MAG: dihydrofolate reductase family protein [Holophaga sp.]|jgi:riboflavin biosynthesis pyrimidine reductase